MKKRFMAALAISLGMLAACGDDSSSSANGENGEYKRDFATSISTGETMFIGTMSLDHTDDIGTDYIEVGTRAGVVYYDNSLFIADLDVGTIARYSLDANNKIGSKTAELSLAGAWANHIYFVNEEKPTWAACLTRCSSSTRRP